MEGTTMKKILGLLCGVLLATGLLAAPAYASETKTVCASDNAVCVQMTVTKDSGSTGFNIDKFVMWCKYGVYGVGPLFGWEALAVDGHGITIKNANGNVLTSLTDAQSNVYRDVPTQDACTNSFRDMGHFPNPHEITFNWTFTEQLNNQHDIDDSISITFTNN